MFDGRKFVSIEKREVGSICGFIPNIIEENTVNVSGLINSIDSWALSFGYEYHSMFADCVVFKRNY